MLRSLTRNSSLRRVASLELATRSLVAGEDQLFTPVTVFPRSLSTSATIRPIPPNLKIDPKSSFAPRPVEEVIEQEEGDTERKEEDVDDVEEAEKVGAPALYFPEPDIIYAVPLPERLNVQVHTLFAPEYDSQVGTLWLEDAVFGRDPIRIDLMKRSVDYYRAKKRGRRKAKTKTISEVSGSGRKIRQQKGTGQARVGHSRPSHFRGGAKAHGPKNTTDYGNTKLNKKVRKQALTHALSQKLKEGNLLVLDQLQELPTHKTKDLARLLKPWDIGGRDGISAMILDHYYPKEEEDTKATSYAGVPINFWVASANLPKVKVGNDHLASVYDILKHEKLVLTLSALQQIETRLKDI